ncbi:MAG: TRAP transporter small permease subunit [Thermodesulfobacteriota bacterium]
MIASALYLANKEISRLNGLVGTLVSFLNLAIMSIVVWEVFCRYLLRSPTTWAMEMNQYLLAALALLAGGYALVEDRHVRVDVVYRRLSAKRQASVDVVSSVLVILFCAVLLWHGSEFALDALRKGKRSMSLLELPLFPSMALVPLGGMLLGLQALAKLSQALMALLGLPEEGKGKSSVH